MRSLHDVKTYRTQEGMRSKERKKEREVGIERTNARTYPYFGNYTAFDILLACHHSHFIRFHSKQYFLHDLSAY